MKGIPGSDSACLALIRSTVLVLGDLDLMSASYLDRRAELAVLDSIIQDVGGLPITVPPHWENQSSKIMLNAARSAGMEDLG